MAYDSANLTRLAGGSGSSLWHYHTTDTIATVNTAAYFTGESLNMIALNDVIIAVTSTGSAIDVVDGLTVTATDSD